MKTEPTPEELARREQEELFRQTVGRFIRRFKAAAESRSKRLYEALAQDTREFIEQVSSEDFGLAERERTMVRIELEWLVSVSEDAVKEADKR